MRKIIDTIDLPKGWKILSLGDLFEFKNGVNADKSAYGSGVKFINIMEILNNKIITDEKIFGKIMLDEKEIQSNLVEYGDVLFNRTSETTEDIGQSAVYLDYGKTVFGGFVIRGKSKNKELLDLFKRDCFQSEIVRKQIIVKGQGAVRSNIGQKELEKILLPVPPLHEQEKIAEILSKWDELIATQSQLITAKQKQKKALMQKLLSGKLRFPGFTDKWEEKTLGEVAKIKTGKKDNKDKVENGVYPFFVRSENIERIDSFSYDGEAILIPGEGRIGEIIHYINGKFDFHQRVYKISDFSHRINGVFCKYYMAKNFKKEVVKNTVKATVDSIRLPVLVDMKINLPQIKEQQKIASVLTACDEEIETLKTELQSLQTQKKGLMQQLLTGKIRVNG